MNTSDKVIKLSNHVRDKYQWKLNIIEKKKFMYSDFDMVFKLLSNSLSRIFTTLENVSGTKCAAVYLGFSTTNNKASHFFESFFVTFVFIYHNQFNLYLK